MHGSSMPSSRIISVRFSVDNIENPVGRRSAMVNISTDRSCATCWDEEANSSMARALGDMQERSHNKRVLGIAVSASRVLFLEKLNPLALFPSIIARQCVLLSCHLLM